MQKYSSFLKYLTIFQASPLYKFQLNKKAFSLIELSIVILIIGILVAGITQGSRIMNESRLKSARALTANSPVNAMSGLVLWLDATDTETLAVGTVASNAYNLIPENNATIPKWKDRNPQEIAASQKEFAPTSDPKAPLYIKNGIGGLPSLKFDGSNDYFENSSATISPNKTNFTLIAVWQSVSNTSTPVLFSQSTNTCAAGVNGASFIISSAGSVNYAACGTAVGTGIASNINTPYIEVIRAVSGAANGLQIRLNQTLSSATVTTNLVGANITTIGSDNNSTTRFFNGLISEIIVFDRAINDSELVGIQSYLSSKYGIRVN